MTLIAGARPKMRAAQKRDWTKAKEVRFLSVLADTCNVTCAAQDAGVSVGAVYARRRRNAAFRAGWIEAVGVAYQRLELVLLDRAFNGTEKVVTRKDGSEERMLEYSNQLGLALLKMHRDTAIQAMPESEPANIEEIRERLFKKLERLRKREEQRGTAE